jgi:hypothetical protein
MSQSSINSQQATKTRAVKEGQAQSHRMRTWRPVECLATVAKPSHTGFREKLGVGGRQVAFPLNDIAFVHVHIGVALVNHREAEYMSTKEICRACGQKRSSHARTCHRRPR